MTVAEIYAIFLLLICPRILTGGEIRGRVDGWGGETGISELAAMRKFLSDSRREGG